MNVSYITECFNKFDIFTLHDPVYLETVSLAYKQCVLTAVLYKTVQLFISPVNAVVACLCEHFLGFPNICAHPCQKLR